MSVEIFLRREERAMSEAVVTINGHRLSEGQAMTVRVALTDFLFTMADPMALGDDRHGRYMRDGYRDRVKEMLFLMKLNPVTPADSVEP
jgi:hypothetical protein